MGFNYSVMLDIENKHVLVIGGGGVAKRKIKDLLKCNAIVTVIAPDILSDILDLSTNRKNQIHYLNRPFQLSDIEEQNPFIVFAASDNFTLNRTVCDYCNEHHILVNSITDPSAGNLSVQASIKKPQYAVSVSTYGQGPGFSRALKEHLEQVLDADFDLAVQIYIDIRQWLFTIYESPDERMKYLHRLSLEQICSMIKSEDLAYDKLLEKVKEWLSCS